MTSGVRLKFNPRLWWRASGPMPGGRPLKVTAEQMASRSLDAAVQRLKIWFSDDVAPRVVWQRTRKAFIPGKSRDCSLVTYDRKTHAAAVHPVFARPETPTDVFECAVFLAMLMCYADAVQSKPMRSPYAHPDTAAWCEAQMEQFPASEYFAQYLSGFFEWAMTLDRPATPADNATPSPPNPPNPYNRVLPRYLD